MQEIRRVEVQADNMYKQRLIRGFLHLYNGQEAITAGMEGAITFDDHIITAYRGQVFLETSFFFLIGFFLI